MISTMAGGLLRGNDMGKVKLESRAGVYFLRALISSRIAIALI